MTMDIGKWLQSLGLGQYETVFRDNEIDTEVLPDLTEADLEKLGVPMGHRKRLLKAIAGLSASAIIQLQPAAQNTVPATTAVTTPTGERRTLTVMFCDVVGSTTLTKSMDAEQWRDIIGIVHTTISSSVERFGGYVAKNLGDGDLVYFGYPRAHDNDGERAVRAGLEILASVAALNRGIEIRVGIHSGHVVLDHKGEVYGDAANVAARVQSAAPPGTVVISGDTHHLVSGMFIVDDMGAQMLKGIAEPVHLLRVVRPSGWKRRHQAANVALPLLGRAEELAILASRWQRARDGGGQVVIIIGEAGLGKSRMVEEFQGGLANTPHTWIEFPCSQILANAPFHPLAEWAREHFGSPDQGQELRFGKLEKALDALKLNVAEMAPLIAPLLDIPISTRYEVPEFPPEEMRRQQLAAMVKWIIAPRSQPIVIVVEDAHWADPSTLELLRLLLDQVSTAPLLFLLAARPEFHATWPHRSHHTMIELTPLGVRDTMSIISAIAAHHALSGETIAAVIARAAGVPLFIEEVTRFLLESGHHDRSDVPATLQASLMARLDRLGSVKEVAQVAAVIGREFNWPLIKAMTGLADEPLRSALTLLAEVDLIHVQGIPPDAVYRFKHALIQDTAYEALLKTRRRELHRLAALALPVHNKALSDSHPELLAHHLAEGGEDEAATAAWQRAADTAMARTAFSEAGAHYRRALKLLEALPDRSQRSAQEFKMRVDLALALRMSVGYGSPEAVAAYIEALPIGERLGDVTAITPIMATLGSLADTGARFDDSIDFAVRLEKLVPKGAGRIADAYAKHLRGSMLFHTGQLTEAITSFDAVIAVSSHGERIAWSVFDLAVTSGMLRLWALAISGRPDTARRSLADLLVDADAANVLPSKASAAFGGIVCAWLLDDIAELGKYAEIMCDLGRQSHITICIAFGDGFMGLAFARQGRPDEGIRLIENAVASLVHDHGILSYRPMLFGILGQARAAAGDLYGAIAALDEGIMDGTGRLRPLVFKPNLRWIKAEIMLAMAENLDSTSATALVGKATDEFTTAITEARTTGARLFELKAATGLARLMRDQGDHCAAHDVLAPVYDWFTEGLDTNPLIEAGALLGPEGTTMQKCIK
ncbi:MAG: AAA family ATPase [Nitrospirae bacterium]|nr:AAA family ATPase [Nitrospirota bacterium]